MFVLRRAVEADIESIYQVDKAVFTIPWLVESIRDDIEDKDNRIYYVIDVDDQVIAYAGAWLVADEGQITNIAVLPNYRRQGYGAILTRKLIKECFAQGMQEIFLEVRVSNQAAQTLYRRLGFTVKGLRKQYYSKPTEDAYIMSLVKEKE